MTTFVALLRGVNVGKAKRVAMADWRAQLEGLGYRDVRTLLNSGNAVFRATGRSADRHAAAISRALGESPGIQVRTVVKSAAELAGIVAANPFAGAVADPSRLLVVFTQDADALAGLAAIAPLAAGSEKFHLGTLAAYLSCPEGILGSKAGAALLGGVGEGVTTRNWATTLKLHRLANPV